MPDNDLLSKINAPNTHIYLFVINSIQAGYIELIVEHNYVELLYFGLFPEFIGKLGFYVTAVNEILKSEYDNPTIGILLCKTKDNLVVDFTLKDVNKPI